MSFESEPSKVVLSREVLAPGREQTGIAVVLVAASALAFALAGSAFALWARSNAHACNHDHSYQPTAQQQSASLSEPLSDAQASAQVSADRPCRSDLVTHDGVSYYRVCPTSGVAVQPAHEVVIEEQKGVVVFRIVK